MEQDELKALFEQSQPLGSQQNTQQSQEDLEALFNASSPVNASDNQVESEEFDGRTSESGIPLRSGENLPEKETSPMDAVIGVAETGATLTTGATGGMTGHIYGTLKGLAKEISDGNFGSQKAAKRIEEEAQKQAANLTYEPETETGKKYVKETVKALDPLNAFAPLAVEAGVIQRAIPRKTKMTSKVSATDEALKEAVKHDIKVMTSDAKPPKTFIGKSAQQFSEKIPAVGTGGLRKAQQTSRVNAIKNLSLQYIDDLGDDYIKEVSSSLSNKRGATINKLTAIKNTIAEKLSGNEVTMSRTLNEIDNQVAALNKIGTKSSKAAAAALDDYKNAFHKQDLKGIELVRKDLGNLFDSPDLVTVKDSGGKAVSAIYKTVNEDISKYIETHGGKQDIKLWKVANQQLSKNMKELDSSAFKNVLKKGAIEPEGVERLLFSKKPSQIKLLYKNLDRDGRRNAKAAIIARAMEKAMGKVDDIDSLSPAKFTSELHRLSDPIATFLTKEDKVLFEGLTKALNITNRADQFALNPPTGVQLTIPVGTAILTDLMGGAGAALATGGVAGFAGRLYEIVPIRHALMKLGVAPKGTKQYQLAVEALMLAIIANMEKDKEE